MVSAENAADYASPPSKPIQTVAIIGAGLMGIEIAAANLHCGLRVLMTDNESANACRRSRQESPRSLPSIASEPRRLIPSAELRSRSPVSEPRG